MNKAARESIEKMNRLAEGGVPFFFVIDFEMRAPQVVPLDVTADAGIFFKIGGVQNYNNTTHRQCSFEFKKFPVPFEVYKRAFDTVLLNIRAGNSYLLNLTFPTPIETDLSLQEIFYLSDAPFKLLYRNEFVVFSPESFVIIKDGIISSFPMKGTIDAAVENAGEKILSDPKESAEHATIVDLIRNDLSVVALDVCVKRYRFIDKIVTHEKNLLQVSSEITGRLQGNYRSRIGEIIFNLLPAGSISGAPKLKTVEIIKEAEIYKRGFYTGVFGLFDGKDLYSAVMIRFIERQGDRLIFKSGGGITAQSDAELEYREMIDKVYVPITRNH